MSHLNFSTRSTKTIFPAFLASAFLITGTVMNEVNAQEHSVAHVTKPSTAKTLAKAPSQLNTVLGDVVPFGNGTARSWAKLDEKGAYSSIGITMTEDALLGLPKDVTPGMIWTVEYILNLPGDQGKLPFKHIGVNWNPRGHMPSGVYNVPHFDFHFYTSDRELRNKITARGKDLETCRKVPGEGFVPEGYMFAPESEEPGMGGHWVDGGSHEFHGKDFTSTFIYGTYDGNVIFWEPMITKAYLESKPQVTIPLKLPAKYSTTGYYPTSYSITFDPERKEYTVSFDGMTLRKGTASK